MGSRVDDESDREELWIEADASHGKVWVAAPNQYRRALGRFCETALGH